jgi:hypothetical protein
LRSDIAASRGYPWQHRWHFHVVGEAQDKLVDTRPWAIAGEIGLSCVSAGQWPMK